MTMTLCDIPVDKAEIQLAGCGTNWLPDLKNRMNIFIQDLETDGMSIKYINDS